MAKFYMLVGTPVEGKSTYAKMLKDKDNKLEIFSTDGVKKDYENQNCSKGTKVGFYQAISNLLKEGIDVVLDSTNLTTAGRKQIFEKMPEDIDIIICQIHAESDEKYRRLRERNAQKYPIALTAQKLYFLGKGLQVPSASEDERIKEIRYYDSQKNEEKIIFPKESEIIKENDPKEEPKKEIEDRIDLTDKVLCAYTFLNHESKKYKTFKTLDDAAKFVGISKKGQKRFETYVLKSILNNRLAYGYMWKIEDDLPVIYVKKLFCLCLPSGVL